MADNLTGGAVRFGEPHLFGIEDPEAEQIALDLGFQPESIEINREREFEATSKNLRGVTVSKVVGPYKFTASLEGTVTDLSKLTATNASFEFRGMFFMISSISEKNSNEEYVKATVSAESFEKITEIEIVA